MTIAQRAAERRQPSQAQDTEYELALGRQRLPPAAEHAEPLLECRGQDDHGQHHHHRGAHGKNPAFDVASGVGADRQGIVVVADVEESAVEGVDAEEEKKYSQQRGIYLMIKIM